MANSALEAYWWCFSVKILTKLGDFSKFWRASWRTHQNAPNCLRRTVKMIECPISCWIMGDNCRFLKNNDNVVMSHSYNCLYSRKKLYIGLLSKVKWFPTLSFWVNNRFECDLSCKLRLQKDNVRIKKYFIGLLWLSKSTKVIFKRHVLP